MNQLLLDLPLLRKSDLIRARQRGRQIAALLAYAPNDQMRIAAAVFEIVVQVGPRRGTTLRFQIAGHVLQVFTVPQSVLRFQVQLPAKAKLDRADLAWAVQSLDQHTPLDVLHEMRQMNQELLQMMHAEKRYLQPEPRPAAA
jgi:hypothetical protein